MCRFMMTLPYTSTLAFQVCAHLYWEVPPHTDDRPRATYRTIYSPAGDTKDSSGPSCAQGLVRSKTPDKSASSLQLALSR